MNPAQYQHYVPKEHIRRFSESDTINVMRYTGESFNKRINRNFQFKIGGLTNFYDNVNPYDPNSMENALADLERILHPYIDEIIEEGMESRNPSDSPALMQYISLLYNRSIFKRLVGRHIAPADEEVKELQQLGILLGVEYLNFKKIDDFKVGIQVSPDEEYITSDNPVVPHNSWDAFQDAHKIKNDKISKDLWRNEFNYICPLTPNVCAFAYHKDSIYSEQLIKNGYYSVESVNKIISHWAIEWVFSRSPFEDDFEKIYLNSGNTCIEDLRSLLQEERKSSNI